VFFFIMLAKMTENNVCNKYVNMAVITLTLLPSVLLAVLFIPLIQSLYHLTPFLMEETEISQVIQPEFWKENI